MFHQMLNFLTLRDEVQNEAQKHYSAENVQESFPPLLNESQIQKVIFDEKYKKYLGQD
jgi:hypothetical protein